MPHAAAVRVDNINFEHADYEDYENFQYYHLSFWCTIVVRNSAAFFIIGVLRTSKLHQNLTISGCGKPTAANGN